MNFEIFDTHAHLDFDDFQPDFDQILARAKEAGVAGIISIGSSSGFESAPKAIALAEKYPNIWASAGIHPHAAATEFKPEILREYALHPKVVAIGEAGLDFFRDWSPKADQYRWFRAQIELAKELKKPIIIHARSAAEECLQVLKELNAQDVGGVFHCYSEDDEFAKRLRDINFLVSFPGSITFKKNDGVRSIIKKIPLEQIMIETDAPYMAPEPYRGKRCESAFVLEVAKTIAKIKEISLEDCAKVLTSTTKGFFKI